MKKQIITISREFGSGGHSIGLAVAEKLGIPFYDQEIVEKICDESGLGILPSEFEEKEAPLRRPFIYNFLGHDYKGMSVPDYLWSAEVKVLEKVAEDGACVIVGRCANHVLREREDVLNVYIHADKEKRAKRIVERYGHTKETPEKRIADKDKKRAAHYEYYTGRKWGNADDYHLCLDSGLLGQDMCVKMILEVLDAAE